MLDEWEARMYTIIPLSKVATHKLQLQLKLWSFDGRQGKTIPSPYMCPKPVGLCVKIGPAFFMITSFQLWSLSWTYGNFKRWWLQIKIWAWIWKLVQNKGGTPTPTFFWHILIGVQFLCLGPINLQVRTRAFYDWPSTRSTNWLDTTRTPSNTKWWLIRVSRTGISITLIPLKSTFLSLSLFGGWCP